MLQYCLHGGGGGLAGAGRGVSGVRVSRLQMSMHRCEHSEEKRTLHVVFRSGKLSATLLHRAVAKPSHEGRQAARHWSRTFAIAGGGAMENRTSAMQAAATATADMHGGGGGVSGDRVSTLQVVMQMCVHSEEILTSHVSLRSFRRGILLVTVPHSPAAKSSHEELQTLRHLSCTSSAIAGGPMDSRTSAMQAAETDILSSMAELAEAIDRSDIRTFCSWVARGRDRAGLPQEMCAQYQLVPILGQEMLFVGDKLNVRVHNCSSTLVVDPTSVEAADVDAEGRTWCRDPHFARPKEEIKIIKDKDNLTRLVQASMAKVSHSGRQIARQSSCRSAITGGPMDNRTSAIQAATESTKPLVEAIDERVGDCGTS
ncbi:hypothetical protein BAE44_0023404 [Dichanthelium oligosanthes]|uniref:Uncharacterized protein n=1 Tax=Dichanthelium oligosanthes TaxID=888268 RepID=A0A1E5URT4_9POAL|nr:hypothetical protein BAE44_0023404 [Dichanthelium oligosanthes]